MDELSVHTDNKYDTVFIGAKINIDDRTKAVSKLLSSQNAKVVKCVFDLSSSLLTLDNLTESLAYHESNFRQYGSILIDATSLEIPEIIYLILFSKINNTSFHVLYVEPDHYSKKKDEKNGNNYELDDGAKFMLSDDGPGINMLPLFSYTLKDTRIIGALGFEGHRFSGLLKSDEFKQTDVSCLIGVPPFVFGWERFTYINNCNSLHHVQKYNNSEAFIAAANDPILTYMKLNQILQSRDGEVGYSTASKRTATLHLAPFGTKPMALSMAWFAVNNQNRTAVIYDFPNKKSDRTYGIGLIHLWEFIIEQDAASVE